MKITCIPCSFPIGHPAGAPAGRVVRLRLVPFGPLTNIRNVFPAFALVKWNNASIKFGLMMTNLTDWMTFAGLSLCTANTLVTFGPN